MNFAPAGTGLAIAGLPLNNLEPMWGNPVLSTCIASALVASDLQHVEPADQVAEDGADTPIDGKARLEPPPMIVESGAGQEPS
jgi:hypothetical protein